MSTSKLHVIPLGEGWDVEDENGASLLHESSRQEAIDRARQIARQGDHATVIVHDLDGVTEEIATPA